MDTKSCICIQRTDCINPTTFESCLMVFTKTEYIQTLYSSNFTSRYVPNINVEVSILKELYKNVYSCFINHQKQEASQASINNRADKPFGTFTLWSTIW